MPTRNADGSQGLLMIVNQKLQITMTEVSEKNMVMTKCQLGVLPSQNREELLRELLAANFMYNGTHGATLSIDPQSKKVQMCLFENLATIHPSQVENTLKTFICDALTYCAKIAQAM